MSETKDMPCCCRDLCWINKKVFHFANIMLRWPLSSSCVMCEGALLHTQRKHSTWNVRFESTVICNFILQIFCHVVWKYAVRVLLRIAISNLKTMQRSGIKPANTSVAWPYADKDLLTTAEEMRSLSWQNRTRTSGRREQTQQQQSQNLVSCQLHPSSHSVQGITE